MGQPTSTGEVRQYTLDIEKKYGLPEGMLYKQAGIESSFGKEMLSPKGAQGWFGFMPTTAKEYGLTDPNDFAQSADAAGRKMRDLMKKHSGNVDYALVDYNGGGNAVTALRDGKPWKESAGYLAKYHGRTLEDIAGRSYAPPPMSEAITSQSSHSSSVVPLASDLATAQRQREATYGGFVNSVAHLPEAIRLGFQTQNTVYNFFKDQGVSSASTELIDWNTKEAQTILSEFPANHWGYLLQGTTQDGVNLRAQRLRDVMGKEKELGNLGLGPALIGGIVGGLPDFPTLLAFVPMTGAASILTKASRLSNAARMGLMGAASNVAYDSVMNQFKPTATADDLYVSGLFGLGLGALSGGVVNPRRLGVLGDDLERLRDYGLRNAREGMGAEIRDANPGLSAVPGWTREVDDWLNNRPGKAPEMPPVGIIREGPEAPVPRPVIEEGRLPPLEADTPVRAEVELSHRAA